LAISLVGIGGTGCNKHVTPFDAAVSAVGSAEFFAREQVARWLLVYDTIALLAREHGVVDPLCWQSDGTWFAQSGDRIFRLSGEEMVPIEGVDTVGADVLGRAVSRARSRERGGDDLEFSVFVRVLGDEVEVWMLPMGLEEIVIGDSWRYVYSASGRELLHEQSWPRGRRTLGADLSLDLTLQSQEELHPTVAELFFALYYRDSFKSVTIETAKYRVTPMEFDGSLGWGRSIR
jgi:hypothetical protein